MAVPKLPEEFAWSDDIALGTPEVYRLSQLAWPRFLLEESDVPDPLLKFQISLTDFKERFKVFGIRDQSSGLLVAFVQAVHVEIDPVAEDLPDLGWRFSIHNASRSSPKNVMSLTEVSIDTDFRGRGLSRFLIERVKHEARLRNFTKLIAPVRPSLKSNLPNESIEHYCTRKNSASQTYDPWLRVHLEAGAVFTNFCHNSVCVKATLGKWYEWTGVPMTRNGPTLVDGALMPIVVDTAANLATYTEPNVWVTYSL